MGMGPRNGYLLAAALGLAWAGGSWPPVDGERFHSDYDPDEHRDDEARKTAAELKRERRAARNRKLLEKGAVQVVEVEEGGACPEPGCPGTIVAELPDGCTCFKVAPCGACMHAGLECRTCGYRVDGPGG